MRLEPRRSGWPLALHTACCSSLQAVPLRSSCSLEMKWDGKKDCVVFISTPATVATWHVVLWSSCPLLPVSAHHVQASGLHGQNVAGACVMPAHIVYAFAVSTFLFVSSLRRMCCTWWCVLFFFFCLVGTALPEGTVVQWAQRVCVSCGYVVGMSAALNPETELPL